MSDIYSTPSVSESKEITIAIDVSSIKNGKRDRKNIKTIKNKETIPYTYLIGWSKLNRWYYGVRFAIGCSPKDLWNPYKTSSKHVKNFILEHGDPDVVEIRKTFNDVNKARTWEQNVLIKMHVVGDEKWINKTDNVSIDPELGKLGGKIKPPGFGEKIRRANIGKVLSEETKRKISIARKGQPSHFRHHTPESIRNLSNIGKTKIGKLNNFYGKHHSEETKQKLSELAKARYARKRVLTSESAVKSVASHIGRKRSPETCAAISAAKKGKYIGRLLSAEHCAAISLGLKGKKKSAKHIENMSLSRMGKKQSPELIARRIAASSEAQRGKKRKPLSPEHRMAISIAHRKRQILKKLNNCNDFV